MIAALKVVAAVIVLAVILFVYCVININKESKL